MKALIVVDMQNDFTTGVLGNPETAAVSPRVAAAVEKFRREEPDGLIIATLDTHFDNYSDTQEGRNLPVEHCIEGTQGWELAEDVSAAIAASGLRAEQVRKGAFGSLDLARILRRDCPPDASVDIVGICTDICVVSNALILKAACPEMKVSVISRCCAGSSPPSFLAAMSPEKSPDGNGPVGGKVVPSLPSAPSESEVVQWFMENRSSPESDMFFDLVDKGLPLFVNDADMLC